MLNIFKNWLRRSVYIFHDLHCCLRVHIAIKTTEVKNVKVSKPKKEIPKSTFEHSCRQVNRLL